MIKVCHLTSVHPASDIRILHKECVSLSRAGYSVSLIAPGDGLPYLKDDIEIVPIKLPKSRLLRMIGITFKMFTKALKVRAKVYHFHDPELMYCGILLRLAGKKVVFDIHENVRLSFKTKEWLPKGLRGMLAGVYFVVERFALLFFNRLILAEESYQKYYPKRKSTIILNYPIVNQINHLEREFLPPYRFIYAGVVHPLKGVWEMLNIISELNQRGLNSRLILVGEVRPESLTDEIHQFLNNNQLQDKVKLIGKVDYTEVSEYLKDAHIGLSLLKPIPNYVESLPTKMFEYMQFGLPVVTNNFPLYKKYIAHSKAGICVDIEKLDEVTEQIGSLLNIQQRLKEFGKNGTFAVLNLYNWKTESQKLIEVYQSLIG